MSNQIYFFKSDGGPGVLAKHFAFIFNFLYVVKAKTNLTTHQCRAFSLINR